jgi:purine nucleosidase
MAETWFKGASEMTFHDPLAAALIFHPGLATYEHGRVEVAYEKGGQASGHTRLIEGEGSDRVAKVVDAQGFFDEYFSVFA